MSPYGPFVILGFEVGSRFEVSHLISAGRLGPREKAIRFGLLGFAIQHVIPFSAAGPESQTNT